MTKEQLAEMLNGRTIGNEIEENEEQLAKENGLVVVFGSSDDLMELRGALYEEYGCYGGGDILFTSKGNEVTEELQEKILDIEIGLGIKINAPINKITAKYHPWEYNTTIPHATFDITEDDELYCRGIVFSINDLK